MRDLTRDLRFARRSLLRTPVLTAGAVISIALGITATSAVFSVVDAALFRPPPFEQPDAIAVLYITRAPPGGVPARERWSWNRFRALGRITKTFETIGSYSPSVLALTSGEAEPVNAEMVSSAYLTVLRARPVAGRAFLAEDDEAAGAHPVALIGYDLWQRRYGGDRSVVGQTLAVNGVTLSVIGVLPRGFMGLSGRAQLWIPATMAPSISYGDYLVTNRNFISVVGRLQPTATMEQARAELAAAGVAVQDEVPSPSEQRGERLSATALSLNEARVDPTTRTPMFILLGSAACLLLLACANVAGLLLGRAVGRRQEIAIRVATGASRMRIVRQLLVESALLAFAGGALGVLAAVPVSNMLGLPAAMWRGRNMYGSLGEFADPRIDVRVMLFSVLLCALTTLVFGLAPALRASRVDLVSALKDGAAGSGTSAKAGRFELRQIVVAAETALATVLLVAGSLFATSWLRLETADGGFDRAHLLTFLIRPPEIRYPPSRAPALIDRVIAEIERVPGVEAASVDGCAPMSTGCANSTLFIVGRPVDSAAAPGVLRHYVGPDHFRALQTPLIRGRIFNDGDRAGSNRVAIVNETAARRFWPDGDPIGQRVWFGGGSNFDRPDSSAEIVGIVGDVAYQAMDAHPVQPDFYTPYAQFTYSTRLVLVRTRGDPAGMVPEMRRAVRRVDPALALFEVQTMNERAGASWARTTYQARVISAFAVIALLLAGVGIFAIIAHVIGDRRRDIGIRVALGASSRHVLGAVGARGAVPAAVGVAIGAAGAIGVGRALSAVVFGVRAFDGLVMAAATVAVVTVSLLATYLSARRALTIAPLEALR